MKKLTLTIVCTLAMTGAAFAQGTINWSIINPVAMTAQTNTTEFFGGGSNGGGTVGSIAPGTSGATFYFELLYNTSFTGSQAPAPDFAALIGGTWLDTGLTATNSSVLGRLAPINPTTAATMSGWAGGIGVGGTTNNIVLVGWSANLGTSWSIVSTLLSNWANYSEPLPFGNAFFGESAAGYIVPNQSNPGANVFGTSASVNGLPINSLNTQLYLLPLDPPPIPEPGTIALAGLGGLSLWLFRRRYAMA